MLTVSLEHATYDPATHTCSNVGCHVSRQSLVDQELRRAAAAAVGRRVQALRELPVLPLDAVGAAARAADRAPRAPLHAGYRGASAQSPSRIVEAARLAVHDVGDHVAVVDEDPAPGLVPLDADLGDALRPSSLLDVVGDGAGLPVASRRSSTTK